MSVYLVVDGDLTRTVARFDKLSTEIVDLTPVWEKSQDSFRELVEARFSAQDSWPALNADYAARKLREGYGGRTMIRTGAGFASLTDNLDVSETAPLSMAIGSAHASIRYNARSRKHPRKSVPANIWRRRTKARIFRYMKDAAKRANG